MPKRRHEQYLKNHPVIRLLESEKKERHKLHSFAKSIGLERYSRRDVLSYVSGEVFNDELKERGITYEQWVKEEYQEEADLNYLTPEQRKKEEQAEANYKPKLKRVMGRMYGAKKRKVNVALLRQLLSAEQAKEKKLPARKKDESRSVYNMRIKGNPYFSCYEFSRATGSFKLSNKLFVDYILTRPEFIDCSRKIIENQISIIKKNIK